MKKRPPIFGIGWTGSSPTGADVAGADLTLSYVGHTFEDAAIAIAAAVGHRGGSGSYPVPADCASVMQPGEVADLLADMIEDECDIVAVFSSDSARTDDPRVVLLRDVFDSGRPDAVYGEARWWPTDDPSTDPYPLIELWASQWPDSLPIAHELKELFEDQWIRLHTVPGSKRLPGSDDEWAVVIDRHNTLLADLVTSERDLIVIMSVVAAGPMPAEADADFWTSVPWHYADPDLLYAHLFVTTSTWEPGALDDLLRLAAEQQIGGVIIAPLDLAWLYHPYAGGVDIILTDPAIRADLAERHAEWRSTHPAGL